MSPLVLGLVGGVASGKSTVAALFAALCPAVHLDADALARRVTARPEVAEELARRFPGVAARDGRIDRESLAARVFADPEALAVLETITHPMIHKAIRQGIRRARAPLVLLDAALLQEAGADGLCDAVVYVACPARTRRSRARRARGWTGAEHAAREARQWSCRRKRARADYVVNNGGDLARTRRDVARVLRAARRRG